MGGAIWLISSPVSSLIRSPYARHHMKALSRGNSAVANNVCVSSNVSYTSARFLMAFGSFKRWAGFLDFFFFIIVYHEGKQLVPSLFFRYDIGSPMS